MNPIEALQAAGLEPIIIDDADDLGRQLDSLLRKRETNTEFLSRIMTFGCPTGPLVQPFIMYAVEYYAQAVSRVDVAELDNGLFSGEDWKATGAWLESELAKHYGRG